MARNILFTAGVVLVILSLFLPWFAYNLGTEESTKDKLYEDGKDVTTVTESNTKLYLDHSIIKNKSEATKGSDTNTTYSGTNDHYKEMLGNPWAIELTSTQSLLYSLYKVVMVILFLSFTVIVLEALSSEADLSSMRIGITLLHLIIIILFIAGIRGAAYEDQGSATVLESPNSNEYVNMSLPFGFGKSLVSNDTHNEYYTLANDSSYGFEKTRIDVVDYDNTNQGSYFTLYSGPSPDDIDWNKNNWNHSSQYENETAYIVWFDKQAIDANVTERDPTPDSTDDITYVSFRIEIQGLEENNNSEVVIRNRIIQAFDASNAPFSATGNQTQLNRLYIESSYYGNQRDASGWSYWGSIATEKNGYLDYTESTADTKLSASWYPSTGFVVSLLGFGCFVGSRFED